MTVMTTITTTYDDDHDDYGVPNLTQLSMQNLHSLLLSSLYNAADNFYNFNWHCHQLSLSNEIFHALRVSCFKASAQSLILGSGPRKYRKKERMKMSPTFLLFLVMVTSFSGVESCLSCSEERPWRCENPCCKYLHIWPMKILNLCKGGRGGEGCPFHLHLCRFG